MRFRHGTRLLGPLFPVPFLLAAAGFLYGCACPLEKKNPASDPTPHTLVVKGPAGALHVEDGGTGGIPVLFVHGLGGDSEVWAAQLAHLRPSRRAVALDMRGHGRSDAPKDGDYSIPAMASDVAAVADALGLQRFVLVGHSWGGPIIAAYAGRHPGRVAGLLFADPAGDLTQLSPKEIEGFRKSMREGDEAANIRAFFKQMLAPAAPGVADKVLASVAKAPLSMFGAAWEGMFAYSPARDLARFGGPMLTVITAQNKEPYSLQNVDRRIQVVEMAGVSHWVMMDKPEEFNAAMDRFLALCAKGK